MVVGRPSRLAVAAPTSQNELLIVSPIRFPDAAAFATIAIRCEAGFPFPTLVTRKANMSRGS
jgi:hypothetical protein